MSYLSQLLKQHPKTRDLSGDELADVTGLSRATAYRVLNGEPANDETVTALSAILGLPFEPLRELAERDRLGPFEAPSEWALLGYDEREAILRVGRQMLESSRRLDWFSQFTQLHGLLPTTTTPESKVLGRRRQSFYGSTRSVN